VLLYVPSSQSMCPMCRHHDLWTVILPYVPSSQSMDRHPALCAVISIYGPSSCPMCRHLNLCALCAVITIYGPSTAFYVPTSDRNPLHDIRQPPHPHQKRKHQLPFFMLHLLFLLIQSSLGFGVICRQRLRPYICIR